ncbi:MAG: hypothetical protein RQ736_05045 [Thiogranum sp.]|nr:hypothetical protein [Thiogranum sp.]
MHTLKTALLLSLLVFVLQACASHGAVKKSAPDTGTAALPQNNGDIGWRAAVFTIAWPAGQAPVWHADAFLAHRVFSGILELHEQDLALWRFHRRAVDDASGHQFSFRFYADSVLAQTIYQEIRNHPETARLLEAGILTNIRYRPLAENDRPQIADTSDPGWSPEMQASWPYFAMGVSRSWLALIDQVSVNSLPAAAGEPLDTQLAFYESVNDRVTRHWRTEGGHAYLHHLNALFGYEEILVRERRSTRF